MHFNRRALGTSPLVITDAVPLPRPLRRTSLRARRALAKWLFDRRGIARALRRDHVLCIGDSHVQIMRDVRVPGVWFRVRSVTGATASGILNPQSTTQSFTIFSTRLARARRWQQILIQLGEVDCGFVIWHRAKRHGLSVEEQLTRTLDSYVAFLMQVLDMGFSRVMVLSVPLPTIDDLPSEWGGEVANLRKEVTATKAERTDLTLRFNQELRDRCEGIGVTFIDATTGHLDSGTGLIDPHFVRKTRMNHHLEDGPYAELLSTELGRLWSSHNGKSRDAGQRTRGDRAFRDVDRTR
jgi:hypothetical protein